jgi:hypothetical protein
VKSAQGYPDDKKKLSLVDLFDDPTLLHYTSTENILLEEYEKNDT